MNINYDPLIIPTPMLIEIIERMIRYISLNLLRFINVIIRIDTPKTIKNIPANTVENFLRFIASCISYVLDNPLIYVQYLDSDKYTSFPLLDGANIQL